MTELIPRHSHNGMYTRRAECRLVRDSMEKEMAHLKEEIDETKAAVNKIIWILAAGFVANLGGTVLVRLLIG